MTAEVIVTAEVERFFSERSPLAAEVASFRPRAQQREMALAVAEAIRDNAILIRLRNPLWV